MGQECVVSVIWEFPPSLLWPYLLAWIVSRIQVSCVPDVRLALAREHRLRHLWSVGRHRTWGDLERELLLQVRGPSRNKAHQDQIFHFFPPLTRGQVFLVIFLIIAASLCVAFDLYERLSSGHNYHVRPALC